MSIAPSLPLAASSISPAVLPNPGSTAKSASASQPGPPSETGSSGLVFTASGATYKGQSIALADVIDDRAGHFTSAQKAQAEDLMVARERKNATSRVQRAGISVIGAQPNAALSDINGASGTDPKSPSSLAQTNPRPHGQLPFAQGMVQQLQGQSVDSDGSPESPLASHDASTLAAVPQQRRNLLETLHGNTSQNIADPNAADRISLSPAARKLLDQSGR